VTKGVSNVTESEFPLLQDVKSSRKNKNLFAFGKAQFREFEPHQRSNRQVPYQKPFPATSYRQAVNG
jgi:hypothetical protein